MKKSLLFVAMAATAFASCTRDEIIDLKQDEINFSVVADNQTRASEVYCANKLMDAFNVYGTYTAGTTTSWYMKNDEIRFENGKWVNKTATRYWSDETHDFYAAVNGTMTIAATPAPPTVVDFVPATTVKDQKDLLYAVATGQKKVNEQVALNFRHALSQIEFRAKNTNAQLYVVINGVSVGQTPSKGTFTFPSASTKDNFVDHEQKNTHNYTTGSWELATAVVEDYTVETDAIAVAGNNTLVSLTLSNDTDDNNRDFSKSMLLLPTSSTGGTTAWTPAGGQTEYDGTYLAVNCKIYNVAGTAYAEGDVLLHEGWAVMPVSFNWEPGKKYIYTFIFGEGDGGYDGGKDPDPTPDPEPDPNPEPDPVLTPISYTVTVDDFQYGAEYDVEMKTE